ncbi:redox-regulated ATPase YchF [Aminipila butyrica]|uniref:Ribosome-binding ATPase YchF n=1 Tax=Aminipila butyrica TaxID=433296 RepID=A0A858BZF2_9FIRM|nr:redox-regulated ATPase YchF [Aminipila butyrica]QIB70114.1 redox-regulated ATPase YchF [Aminipila butyrica]
MKLGIVGLPNVGKSTLFNAITKAGAEAANYPFCTIEPNVGVVAVPDQRLQVLTDMYKAKRTVHTSIEFYDIAGLVKGASKGEGLGNKFLGHIREVAAIIHVVRCFEDPNVVHVDGKINPLSDIETINMELILSDMEVVERRLQRTQKNLKGDKSLQGELDILQKVLSVLEEGLSARTMELTEEEEKFVKSLELLSYKPIIYGANVSEEELAEGSENEYVQQVRAFAATEGSEVVVICAKVEAEISELEEEEKEMFLEELGIQESGLDKLIKSSYHLLDLISFLTAGEPEVRAWTIKRGTKAPGAAGKIHTDFERGFIRAETIAYDKLLDCGGNLATAKEKGLIRSEGKEYEVKDGDVIHFLFNV